MSKIIETEKEELLVGIISDTHIPHEGSSLPDKVINDFKEKNIDFLFAVGDYVTYEAYGILIELFGKEKVIAVLGNMDFDPKLKEILPETMRVDVLGHNIFMVHGGGSPHFITKRLKKKYDLSETDIIIFGHTHHPYNEVIDGKLFINPGSVNDKRFTYINSYGYLHLSKDKADFEIITI